MRNFELKIVKSLQKPTHPTLKNIHPTLHQIPISKGFKEGSVG